MKQGDNSTLGFLMPDLQPYFRFLVDRQEFLNVEKVGVDSELDKNRGQGPNRTSDTLSLLGSVYAYGKDEDSTTKISDLDRNTHVGVFGSTYAFTRIEQAESFLTSNMCSTGWCSTIAQAVRLAFSLI